MITTILDAPWWAWLLGIIILVFLFWVFRLLINWYIKKGEKEDAISLKKSLISNDKPGNYSNYNGFYAPDSDSKFYSVRNRMLIIRVMNFVVYKTTEHKDRHIFATSLPHFFTDKEKRKLLLLIPQLVDVNFESSHEILITKSPAVDFCSVNETILKFIFSYLEDKYSWMVEKQVIDIGSDFNKDSFLCFYLKTETCFHVRLVELILEIPGTSVADNSFSLMKDRGNYNFTVLKQKSYTLEGLLPQIKETIKNYFPVEVEFTGFNINQKQE